MIYVIISIIHIPKTATTQLPIFLPLIKASLQLESSRASSFFYYRPLTPVLMSVKKRNKLLVYDTLTVMIPTSD